MTALSNTSRVPAALPERAAPLPVCKPMPGYLKASALFVLAWIVLSLPWLLGSLTIPYDAKAHFQAQIQFLANALHTDQSPFWSPHVFVGTPHIADPQSLIFSPAYLLAWFEKIPSFRDLDVYVLLLLGIGGLAIMAFSRDRGWHPAGALVAAIVFAFGASAAWRLQHIGQIQSHAFFALSLWLMMRALDRSSLIYGALAGAAIGAMIIEPDQVALIGCYALAVFVIGYWWQQGWRWQEIRRSLPPLVTAATVMVLLAGIPLVMTTLYAAESNRPVIEFSEAVKGSLHPGSLLTAVIGDLYGALDPRVPYWGPHSLAWHSEELALSQNMSQIYLGALPILLMLTVGLSRGLLMTREIRPAVIALVLTVLYSVGYWTPAFRVFYDALPGVAIFRRPADATFIVGAVAAVVSGYLVHCWASGLIPHADWRKRIIEGGVIASVFVLAIVIALVKGHLDIAWKPIGYALFWISASAVLVWGRRLHAMRAPLLVMAAPALLLTADLAWNNGPNESTALPTANYDILNPNSRNATIQLLKERVRRKPGSQWRDRVELVGLGFEWPNAAMIHGLDHTLGYNPLRIGIVSDAVGAGDTIAGPDQRNFTPLFPSYNAMLPNLLGLRFIASPVPIDQVDPSLKRGDLNLIARTTDGYIYENPRALPRVMFASNWQHADFEQLMETGQWPDFDPRQTVLLEAEPGTIKPKRAPRLSERTLQEQGVFILTYENTIVEIEVESEESGFVVLNDAWHPWWTATVDGRPRPVLRANVVFRAVRVPAGRHIVRFEFKPFSGAVSELTEKLFGAVPPQPVKSPTTIKSAKKFPLPATKDIGTDWFDY